MSVKKKRKDDNHKEFAVGTKIEYNNKLYEVIESNSCVDCSIASICSSSNIMFKNEADVQYVIDNPNFRDILDNIFKV